MVCDLYLLTFQTLVLIVVGVGTLFCIIFHIGTTEPKDKYYPQRRKSTIPQIYDGGRVPEEGVVVSASAVDVQIMLPVRMKWSEWLKEKQFDMVGSHQQTSHLMAMLLQYCHLAQTKWQHCH